MESSNSMASFLQKVLVVIGVVLLVSGVGAAIVLAMNQVLIVILAIILAIPMAVLITYLANIFRVHRIVSFLLTWLIFVVLISGLVYFGSVVIADQFESYSTIVSNLQEESEQVPGWIPASDSFLSALSTFDVLRLLGSTSGSNAVESTVKAIFGGISAIGILFIVVTYITFSPQQYRRGFIAVLPKKYRTVAKDTANEITDITVWWMVSRLVSMLAVGVLTYAGLWLIGVEAALLLAATAALLSFIPNLGPILSVIPALFVAVPSGITTVILVVALYLLVQVVEGYLITPYAQQKAVSVMPALLISVQIIFGAIFGLLGLLLAGPLLAIAVGLHKHHRT